MPKRKSSTKKFVLVTASLLLIAGIAVGLELTNIVNLINKPVNNAVPLETENSIDYSPATEEDNNEIETKKETNVIDEEPSAPTKDTKIEITFIASSQDSAGGQLEIRTLLGGAVDGICELTLSKDSENIGKQSNVIQQNTYFQCEAFNIPYSELANGEWQIKLKVTTGDGRTNEASTSTTIN